MEFGPILAIFLTLAAYTFLYKDNLIFKFAEHLFIGVAAGYWLVSQYHSNFLDNLWHPFWNDGIVPLFTGGAPTASALLLIVPLIFGVLLLCKYIPSVSWLNRWPLAIVVGTYAGLAIIGFGSGDLIIQIRANILPFFKEGSIAGIMESVNMRTIFEILYNPILVLGLPCALLYFFFSKEHTGALGKAARVGIWFLMISFGASYGNTVMTRISLAIERFDTMIASGLTSSILIVLIIALLVMLNIFQKNGDESAT